MKTLLGIVLAHAAGIAFLVLLGIWISPAINHYRQAILGVVSVLSTGFGIYSFVLNLLYHKNLSFHLLVDRLRLFVSRTHTYWLPAFDFELAPDAARDRQAIINRAVDAVEQAYGDGASSRHDADHRRPLPRRPDVPDAQGRGTAA